MKMHELIMYSSIFLICFYFVTPILYSRVQIKFIFEAKKLSAKFLWIYSALLPTFFLIFIRFEMEIFQVESLPILLIIFLPFVVQLLGFYITFNKYSSKQISNYRIVSVNNAGFHSVKTMEYFVVLILPFITISNTSIDKATILYVFSILILLFIKLEIYYLNLPILLFLYVYEVTLSDNKKYYLISKFKEIEEGEEYKIIRYSNGLKLALLHSKVKKGAEDEEN